MALANRVEKRAERSTGGAGAGLGAAATLLLTAGMAVTSGAATEEAREATGMTPPVSCALGVASIAFRPACPPSVVEVAVNTGGGGGAGDGGGGGLGDGGGGGGGLGDGGGGGLGDGGGGGGGEAATTTAAAAGTGWPTTRDEASLPMAKSNSREVISARAVARISAAADRGGSAAFDVSSVVV